MAAGPYPLPRLEAVVVALPNDPIVTVLQEDGEMRAHLIAGREAADRDSEGARPEHLERYLVARFKAVDDFETLTAQERPSLLGALEQRFQVTRRSLRIEPIRELALLDPGIQEADELVA